MTTSVLIIGAVILLLCVTSSKALYRFGVPTLLIFLGLGMVFGSDGLVGIYFDNYQLAGDICSIGLIFIMFFGGFGTNWKTARPVAVPAALLSTLGVVITALLTGMFCYWVLGFSLLEGFLVGSVIASTDAASVFSILHSRKLDLKNNLAPMLEIESGSNDPFAYMLTMILLTLFSGEGSISSILTMLAGQIFVALAIGFAVSFATAWILRHIELEIEGLYPIFVTAVVVLSYSVSEMLGGNGYLCVYIIGIVLGNSRILHKRSLVHFFDGISWLMQILLFFTLGLLSFPSQLPQAILPGISVALFLLLIARPAAVFSILSWFKVPVKQQFFVSWVGLRGAASIVFAIFAVVNPDVTMKNDLFHIVFCVAILSVAVQGTLIPPLAKRLDLVEEDSPVLKTFTDYQEQSGATLLEFTIQDGHPWAGKTVMDAEIPEEILIVLLTRGSQTVLPKGSTVIKPGDVLLLSSSRPEHLERLSVQMETSRKQKV